MGCVAVENKRYDLQYKCRCPDGGETSQGNDNVLEPDGLHRLSNFPLVTPSVKVLQGSQPEEVLRLQMPYDAGLHQGQEHPRKMVEDGSWKLNAVVVPFLLLFISYPCSSA